MRKKLREIMDKEEGFTLVELLAVIVILGIIMAIAVPSIGGLISKTQEKADTAEEEVIVDAARLYFISELDNVVPQDAVAVSKLESTGYLEILDDESTNKKGVVTIKNTETDPKKPAKITYTFSIPPQ